MAGYWPSSFCVFMDRDGVEVHEHAKKKLGQYPAILSEEALSIITKISLFRNNNTRLEATIQSRIDPFASLSLCINTICLSWLNVILQIKGNSNNDITAIETWSALLSFYQTFTCFTIRWKVIGHFQVRSSLYFKASLSAKALWW